MTDTRRPRWAKDAEIAKHYSVSRATVWRWVQEGKLPQPKKIGNNATRFDWNEIEARDAEFAA